MNNTYSQTCVSEVPQKVTEAYETYKVLQSHMSIAKKHLETKKCKWISKKIETIEPGENIQLFVFFTVDEHL